MGGMSLFVHGDVTTYYEVHGSGFPLLLLPPGGMNAIASWWSRAAFNPVEIFRHEFLVINLDQRNAGSSTGPIDLEDPWGGYAKDQIALMNHLGIERFHVLGCCIGCSYALNLIEHAPNRVVSAVLEQPVGLDEKNKTSLPNMWVDWSKQLLEKRPELDMTTLENFGKKMWAGDFTMSVTRDFVKACTTPLLVLPGIDLPHPTAIGREVAALAPNAEIVEPWKEPPELLPGVVAKIRHFLREHTPKA
jgi:pimeloyl-ACP methyl ester carboxylesterase